MSFIHELSEDFGALKESIFENSKNRFEFDGKGKPIIAVQGVWGVWRKNGLRRFMEENKLKGVLVNMGLLEKGIDSYVELLREEVEKCPNPIIIGFSAGGLVALRYAEKYGWDGFDKLITVATPFNGTRYAYLAIPFGQTYTDLLPTSKLLREVKSIIPPKNKVFSFFAESDRHSDHKEIRLNWPFAILDANAHGELTNGYDYTESILSAGESFLAE